MFGSAALVKDCPLRAVLDCLLAATLRLMGTSPSMSNQRLDVTGPKIGQHRKAAPKRRIATTDIRCLYYTAAKAWYFAAHQNNIDSQVPGHYQPCYNEHGITSFLPDWLLHLTAAYVTAAKSIYCIRSRNQPNHGINKWLSTSQMAAFLIKCPLCSRVAPIKGHWLM